MHEIEEMPLFIEDTISQELIRLFHDTTMAQNYHFLSALSDLPAEYGTPLRLTLACIPEHTLSLLHLHGFHTFITCISPTLIYPTFHHIFFTMSMGERDHYITQAELLHQPPACTRIDARRRTRFGDVTCDLDQASFSGCIQAAPRVTSCT